MTESLNKKTSCFAYLYAKRYLLIALSSIIILLSLLMAKANPKQVSYAREYGRLYRNLAAIQNGNDLKPKKLEEHLLEFPSLCPIFDSFLSDYYIKTSDFENWSKTYNKMTSRYFLFDKATNIFSKASVFLAFNQNDKAMQQCKDLKDNHDKKNSLLSMFNLYRLKQNYQEAGKLNLVSKCHDLLCLKVEEIKGSKLENSYLYKKIAAITTTHSKEQL